MSRSSIFSSLASQGVDATEFGVLDGGLSKSDVGLGNVDNVADASQTSLGTVTTGTLGNNVTGQGIAKAWGRIEDNILTSNLGVSGISVTNAATRIYTVTMSPAMSNDDYAVVTTGYAHEGGQVEGSFGVKTGSGGVNFTTTQFMLEFQGNTTNHVNGLGFVVFGT